MGETTNGSTERGTSAVSVVWCDFGGVLTSAVDEAFARVVGAAGVPGEALRSAAEAVAAGLGLSGVVAPLELGLLSQAEWGRRVTAALAPRWRPRVDLGRFGDHFYAERELNVELLVHLGALRRRGLRVGMLTNSVREWEPHRAALLATAGHGDDVFEAVLRSHEAGLAKPDEAFFALAESAFAAAPGQCLLIDDAEANCAAARRRGWAAVRHAGTASTADTVAAVDRLTSADGRPVQSRA